MTGCSKVKRIKNREGSAVGIIALYSLRRRELYGFVCKIPYQIRVCLDTETYGTLIFGACRNFSDDEVRIECTSFKSF